MGALTNKIAIVFNALIAGGIAAGASLLLKLSDSGVWAIWISLFALFSLIQAFIYFRSGMNKVSNRLTANSKANRAVSDELKGVQNTVAEVTDEVETASTGHMAVGSGQIDANGADTTVFNHSFPFDVAEKERDGFEDLTEEAVNSEPNPVEAGASAEDFGIGLNSIDEIDAEEADMPAATAHKSAAFDLTDHFPISEESGSDASSIVFGGGLTATGSVALAQSIEIEPDVDRLPDPELAEWARPIVTHEQPIGQIREGVNAIGEVSGNQYETPMPDLSDAEEKSPLLASVLRNKVEELQAARLESETDFNENSEIYSGQVLENSDASEESAQPEDSGQNTGSDQSVEQLAPEFFDVSGASDAFSTSDSENEVRADFSALQAFKATKEPGELDAAELSGEDIRVTEDPEFEPAEQHAEVLPDETPLEALSDSFNIPDASEPSNESPVFETIAAAEPADSDDRRTNTREISLQEVPALKDAFDQMALEEMTLSSGRAISGNMDPGRLGVAAFTTSFEGELPPMGEPNTDEIEFAEIEVAEIEVAEIEVAEIEVAEIEVGEPEPRPIVRPAPSGVIAETFQDGSSTGEVESVVMNKIAAAINRQANSGSGISHTDANSNAGDDFLDITSEIGGMSIPDQRPTASAAVLDSTDDGLLMDLEDLLGAPDESADHSDGTLQTIRSEVNQTYGGSEREPLRVMSGPSVESIGGLATAAILAAIPEPEVDMSACQIWTNDCGDPDAFVEQPDLEVSGAHALETLSEPAADRIAPLTDDAIDLTGELSTLAGEPVSMFATAEPATVDVAQLVIEKTAPEAEEIVPEKFEITPVEVTADTAIEDTEPGAAKAVPVLEAVASEMVEITQQEITADILIEDPEPAVADMAPVVEAAEPELVEVKPLDVAADTAIKDAEPAVAEADPVEEVAELEMVEVAPPEVVADIAVEDTEPSIAEGDPVVEADPVEEVAELEMVEAAPPEVVVDTVVEDTEPAVAKAGPVVEAAEPELVEVKPLDVAADTAIKDAEPAVAEADPVIETAEPELTEVSPIEGEVEVAAVMPAAPTLSAEKPLIAQPGAAVPAAEQEIGAVYSEGVSNKKVIDNQNSEEISAKRLQAASAALAPSQAKTGAKPVFEIRPDVLDTIRYALEYDTVDLFMQPIINMNTKKVSFFEALSRVRGPDDEYIMPDRYLRPATESGVISVIDYRMLTRAVQVLRKMSKSGREMGMFFNLSLHTLQDEKSFIELIDFMRDQADLSDRIVFEMTQPVCKQLGEDEWDRLRELSTLGFVFSMDNVTDWVIDFGLMSGRGFRFIKVEAATMTRGMADNGAMVRAQDLKAALARRGLTIIGEKLETKNDFNLFRQCNIDFVQGYLVGKPKRIDPASM